MAEQMENRIIWILEQYNPLQNVRRSPPFARAGCNWCIVAYPKADKNDSHFSLFLELADAASLPPGWTREVKYSLTLVSKFGGSKSKGGQRFFNAEKSRWGFQKFVSLTKLREESEGFLENNSLTIHAEINVLPAVVVEPEETVKITEPLSSIDGNQAVRDEVSDDDAPKKDVRDEVSSLVSNDSTTKGSSLHQVKSLEDASQTVESGGVRGLNTVASVTETANNLIREIQPAKETVDINGFDVCFSQVESVRQIFRRHPDIASGFRPKNRGIRRAYMNELLSLIEILRQPPERLSDDDLRNADDTLAELSDVGFKLDWLKTKLNEVSEKKKEPNTEARLREIEEKLRKMKLMLLDLETQVHMERKRLWQQELLPRSTM